MKGKLSITLILGVFFLLNVGYAGEKAPQSVVSLANSKLAQLGAERIIVQAVKAENNKNKSLNQIQEMDKKWRATPGVADFMKDLMDNACARFLIELLESQSYYAEIFVMDNQGANVCQTDKTSDYWQGDEAKFKNSYAGGRGSIFIDEVEFDDSTQAYLVQVSVPVKDGAKVIGAITFGIDVDRVD